MVETYWRKSNMNHQEDKKLQQLKYKLENMEKRKIRKTKEWQLNRTEQTYIIESLGYALEPVIYEIKTRTFKDLYHIYSPLIKEIHYASKAGKKRIGKSLSQEEMQLLEEHNIKFRPVKFRVILIPE